MWSDLLAAGGPNGVQPSLLRQLRIYGGAQGIWVDRQLTSSVEDMGITVGLLHTGVHYPDELADDGVIYHYPKTKRTGGRDDAEIAATKAASTNQVPVFVITRPRPTSGVRDVHLAWVEGWDDDERWFLVTFGDAPPSEPTDPLPDRAPFQLRDERLRKPVEAKSRPGQHRFKFQVLRRYGSSCAMCESASYWRQPTSCPMRKTDPTTLEMALYFAGTTTLHLIVDWWLSTRRVLKSIFIGRGRIRRCWVFPGMI